MEIHELKSYSRADYAALCSLMGQLSEGHELDELALMRTLADWDSHLYVLCDGERIVGCATLCVFHSPTGTKASVEDVVVDAEYRGRGLGRVLMEYVIRAAGEFAPIDLNLTSRPSRVAANALYRSLGFERRDTNFYRLHLDL